MYAPVVQWIEQGTSKPLMGVRFPPGVQITKDLALSAGSFVIRTLGIERGWGRET